LGRRKKQLLLALCMTAIIAGGLQYGRTVLLNGNTAPTVAETEQPAVKKQPDVAVLQEQDTQDAPRSADRVTARADRPALDDAYIQTGAISSEAEPLPHGNKDNDVRLPSDLQTFESGPEAADEYSSID